MNRRTLLKSLAALCATPLAKPTTVPSGDVVRVEVLPMHKFGSGYVMHEPSAPTWMASGWYETPTGPLETGDGVIVHASNDCIMGCVCGSKRQAFPPEHLVIKPGIL
jgi:hypothetical protein